MLRHDRAGAVRFMLGLLVGGLVGSLVLAVPVYLLGRLFEELLSGPVRAVVFVVVVLTFGVVDLTLRTPHVQRQVPQSLVRTMPPGVLGLVWGVDLAMLFTTQKTTSFVWVALAGLVLVAPGLAPVVLVLAWTAAWLAMAYLTIRRPTLSSIGEERLPWEKLVSIIRRVSGTALIGAALVSGWLMI
ncbi:hypothetical protein KZZ52_17225 [Dactylosporangium sp. AC04546]|uniref:hypothetical protein n=1 Tax=Dactylosporangium sp. AC04546 TaxID=2862460 RepID=UPI001EDF468D|nr:hypothetical protein [Dactylosporangium sp. AC04546]WVK87040.1 hypothetical protein KZZ52_17225 [Dactylosporangium sp. AC04546]